MKLHLNILIILLLALASTGYGQPQMGGGQQGGGGLTLSAASGTISVANMRADVTSINERFDIIISGQVNSTNVNTIPVVTRPGAGGIFWNWTPAPAR